MAAAISSTQVNAHEISDWHSCIRARLSTPGPGLSGAAHLLAAIQPRYRHCIPCVTRATGRPRGSLDAVACGHKRHRRPTVTIESNVGSDHTDLSVYLYKAVPIRPTRRKLNGHDDEGNPTDADRDSRALVRLPWP